ncbi:hypothetical protein JZM40_15430 [Acinetobacter pittii]|uniref:ATP-binding protein n=1 Tax=Acinetobacter haemolyticus TaxID=29430 RepID=A0AAW4JA86_ACIHA|nr:MULTISPECIES: hypothetical protein [Acinetobacter]MBN6533021.1 hypothetical protein [Acinetobacter pittii]MBO3656920.1 hypothetical protein [Acinetobacter haemolyticus]
MTLDIKGGLKNTPPSANKYVVVEELLSNAIDSYLIRRKEDLNIPKLSIIFEIEFYQKSLFTDGEYDLAISCLENGAGFCNEQVKAFVTKDSTFKDYLHIQGLGKCKGAGRIQFFHYFETLNIDSVYLDKDRLKRRKLSIKPETREISEAHFSQCELESTDINTKVTLKGIKKNSFKNQNDILTIRNDFSALILKKYVLTTFLQRLILLKELIGEFSINFHDNDNGERTSSSISSDDLPSPVDNKTLVLRCSHSNLSKPSYALKITRYSITPSENSSEQHEVALCANSAIVCSLAKKFFRTTSDIKKPIDGYFELILVESEFLESKVNQQRDAFNIPKECSSGEDLIDEISMQDIIEALEDYVYLIITPKDFDKEALINSTQERFGISRTMLEDTNIKIHFSDTEENIAKRVLKKLQEDIVKDTSNLFDIKQRVLLLDPRSEDFRTQINDLSWKYTSTLKKMDMANLSQLIVRRSSMIEVLRKAVRLMLACQEQSSVVRREDEKIIHNVFFPTGKNNTESIDHDIWILNEEYHYFEHIASDRPLSSFVWKDHKKLFESDIDESLEALFKKNNNDHSKKRPDIAIFNEEGSAIIIEFKAPKVPLQDHIPDLVQYSRLLAAKSGGKIKKFYGYLIGTELDESRMPTNYEKFPSGLGYFNTSVISDPATRIPYGELYTEILFYDQFIDRAEKRLNIYKKKLNIEF